MKILLQISVLLLIHPLLNGQNFKILSQLPLNDDLSLSTLKYGRKEYGIGLLNSKGSFTKEQTLNATPVGMGIMGDNVLLITAEEKNQKTRAYNALLIKKGGTNVLFEKSLFTKDNSNRISTTLLNDPNNNFGYVLFRETKYDEGFNFFGPSGFDTKFLESASLELYALNNKLEPKKIEISTEAANTYFAGACADNARNIYICSFTKDNMVMEKFDSTGKLQGKLSSPFSVWKNPGLFFKMQNDKDNQGSITIAGAYMNADKKQAHNAIRFDFTGKKVYATGEMVLNKQYLNSLKNAGEIKGRNFVAIYGLVPIQILEDLDRVIVVKEIQYEQAGGKGESTTYYREGAIITVYNKKTFEVERDILIDKKLASFVEQSEGIFARVSGNNLWAVTCEKSGLASFKTYVHKINLTTGELTKEEIEKEDIGKGWITFPKQTGWFKKSFVVPFFKITSPFSFSFETGFITKPY